MGEALTRLAVLIDAENVPREVLPWLMKEVTRRGRPTVRRAYADWTTRPDWKEDLLQLGIQAIQVFPAASGKNSADAALIVDAMDILHSGAVKGFCIVSSDSDFTRLCARVRESGMTVYGFGKDATLPALKAACDEFICTETLLKKQSKAPEPNTEKARAPKAPTPKPDKGKIVLPKDIVTLISGCVTAATDKDGWALVEKVHQQVKKARTGFTAKTYGPVRFTTLVKNAGHWTVQPWGKDNHPHMRLKS